MAVTVYRHWVFRMDWIMGAVRMTQRSKYADPQARRYLEWKKVAALVARAAGVPEELEPRFGYTVGITIGWKGRARVDVDNVAKAVLDACWPNDRRVQVLNVRACEKSGADLLMVAVSEHDPIEA